MLLPPCHPPELRVLHIGGYWRGTNDIVRHMMQGLKGTGASVLELCTDSHPEILDAEGRRYDRGTSGPVWLRSELMESWLIGFDPQLVVCNAGGLSFRPEIAEQLRRSRCLLGIALSDPDVYRNTTRRIAANFDRFLTNAPDLVADYRKLGVHAEPLDIGTNPDFFRPADPRPSLKCDVLILGRAHPDRIDPVRSLVARFDVHVYGEGWEDHGIESRGIISGDDVLAALSSAAMTIVFSRTPAGHSIVKVGLFDFLAAGALVVTNRDPVVSSLLTFGQEIVGFDSVDDLLTRVKYYLRHQEAAERIRQSGRARVLRDHTWRVIWLRILRSLGGTG